MQALQRRRSDHQPDREAPIRVLIVDDDPSFRAYLAALTRRLGLLTETASDGAEGLAKLVAGDFDLLLSDYEMPRRNGLDLIAAVRGEAKIDAVYAVMLTSHEEMSLKIEALTLGYDDFLHKSCTEVEVLAKVAAARRMLARQRALDQAMREWQGIARRDELTGVFTRRYFFDEAERMLAGRVPVAIVLIDLDDFKQVNDTYGHLTGDRILRDVGALFVSRTRHSDTIARFGGDEFVLLVCDLTIDETRALAQRLAEDIHALQWTTSSDVIQVSATTGVGSSRLLPDATAEQILDAADRDLYANKWLRKHPDASRDDVYRYHDAHEAEVVRLERARIDEAQRTQR